MPSFRYAPYKIRREKAAARNGNVMYVVVGLGGTLKAGTFPKCSQNVEKAIE
jgi:hypothetical protein